MAKWAALYGLDVECVDVGDAFVAMLHRGPANGYGKVLNPCVDCKIFMLARARELMRSYGARCILSGEVVGQRPMSQRRDALNAISRDAGVRGVLVRPLCARHLDISPVEEAGIIDRDRLPAIAGRGRKVQLELARAYGFAEIPTPAGGCKLAESESARRYWPVLRAAPRPTAADFDLANVGRQYWCGAHWLTVGRNRADNERIESLAGEADLVLRTVDFPGPLAVGRRFDAADWPAEVLRGAGALVASFSGKAVAAGGAVRVSVTVGPGRGRDRFELAVAPERTPAVGWAEPGWNAAKVEIRERMRTLRGE
jgi:hypothetical protein